MCGIAGFLGFGGSAEDLRMISSRMAATLRHRGPDDEGVWVDPACGVGLAHRRLSILDLSPAGHQPMTSESGRYILVFNGEMYNFQQLRAEVEATEKRRWRGHSDTEVLLACIEQWGLLETLKRSNGMFAIALWDRDQRVISLARDRLGEKPIYYGRFGNVVLFGSEVNALRVHPAFRADIDRDALALSLRHNCIPAPYTIYHGVYKLLPGTMLCLTATADSAPVRYWTMRQAAEAGASKLFTGSTGEAANAVDALLRDSIKMRMISDVPLGAFLSGGVDSSTVVALMQAQSRVPVRTFSIGYTDQEYDEAAHAKRVALHLGTQHTEFRVSPEHALAVIPRLPELYDEPFADASQIPTFLVAQLARQQVTVALSGDGGDEVFGGYNRYTWAGRVWNSVGWLPRSVRRAAASAMTSISPEAWDGLFQKLKTVLPTAMKQRTPGDKLHKLAAVLDAHDAHTLYFQLASHWFEPAAVVIRASEPSTQITDSSMWANLPAQVQQMMYLDSVTYLPDDILVKVDRASMGVGLEARVPLLDHRVVEFAWRLPLEMKLRKGVGKWILRQVLYRYVPRELVDRPKSGFGIPIDNWLRGPLRDWSEALLDESRLRQEGFFHPEPIRRKWAEHLSGRHNWQYHLWDVLMFQAWQEHTRQRQPLAQAHDGG